MLILSRIKIANLLYFFKNKVSAKKSMLVEVRPALYAPEKIGHRGACGYAPENTLASFQKAIELGVNIIELDVHATWDKRLAVIHDPTLDRTTNGHGFVRKKTLNEIQEFDAGNGEKVPTLEDVLDLIDKDGNKSLIKVNIELKEETAKLVAQVIQIYIDEKNWSPKDFIVSSFDHDQLKVFSLLQPSIKIGALTEDKAVQNAQFGKDLKANFVGIDKDIVTKDFVKDAHTHGIMVYVFTVNEPDAILEMTELGVDGIFSNYPDRI
jgi:glycerophosphoryl diester phosphodiesterase